MDGSPRLVFFDGTGTPQTCPLDADVITVGSGSDVNLRIADPELASIHCSIQRDGTTYLLVRHALPLAVNGHRPRTHLLQHGDLVVAGRTALWFQRSGAPLTTTTTSASKAPGDASSATVVDLCHRLVALAKATKAPAEASLDEPATPRAGELATQLLDDALALTQTTSGTLLAFTEEGDASSFASTTRGDLSEEEALYSRTLLRRLRDGGEPIFVADTRLEPDLMSQASVLGGAGRTVFAAPVRAGERILGALYLSRRADAPRASNGDDARLVEVATLYAELAASFMQTARDRASLETRLDQLGDSPRGDATRILGSAAPTRELVARVRKVAAATVPVLLLGETGTGKEVVAHEIHRLSARASGPFVAVHCGAIAPDLLASELFGHKRGAFTQAVRDRPGFFRSADGGTLFLDEIGDMPLAQQVALLRVLQEGRVTPVGDEASVAVDVRIVCATNRALEEAVAQKAFRQDLYFRIAGVTLTLPPLRERGGDVIELAAHFLRRERRASNRPDLSFTDGALAAMRKARWDGNVRELEATVRRAVVMAEGSSLTEVDLGFGVVPDASFVRPLALARDEYLKEYVREVVARFGGNRTAAAEALLVTPRTVFRYLEEL